MKRELEAVLQICQIKHSEAFTEPKVDMQHAMLGLRTEGAIYSARTSSNSHSLMRLQRASV
jgi:hypothetical protein